MQRWTERQEQDKTIRTANYEGYGLEVTATPVGKNGDFAATYYRTNPHGGGERYNKPQWGKSAAEALDKACRDAIHQVDADR